MQMSLKFTKLIVISCFALLLASCAQMNTPVVQLTSFNPAEVAFIKNDGANTISGSGFMRQQGGNVVTCAGADVFLAPVTAFSTERTQIIYGNTQKGTSQLPVVFANNPPGYLEYMRTTRCDAQGNFVFAKVPDGEYFVVTRVIWQVGYTQQGGQLMERVTVAGGEAKAIVLSP